MDGILVFFSTFEPKDWVTAGLAVVALLLSSIAITQASRHLPKPAIVASLWFKKADQHGDKTDMVVRQIANHGNATAEDVWVWLYHRWIFRRRKSLPLDHGERLQPGESIDAKWGASPATRKERILITWRQAPNMKRVRRKRLRVKHIPSEFGREVKMTPPAAQP